MVTRQDDVVVTYGMGEEIIGLMLVGELYHLLGSTEVGLGLTPQQLSFCDEMAGKVARYLEDGDGSLFHIPSDAHANTRLEVSVKLVTLYHIKRYGAMGKQHLTRFWVDGSGIRLESTHAQ